MLLPWHVSIITTLVHMPNQARRCVYQRYRGHTHSPPHTHTHTHTHTHLARPQLHRIHTHTQPTTHTHTHTHPHRASPAPHARSGPHGTSCVWARNGVDLTDQNRLLEPSFPTQTGIICDY